MALKQFDCIVLGGGLIGLTATLALAKLNLNTALVESCLLYTSDAADE